MKPISDVVESLEPGKRILFETPQMRDRFIQGGTVLDVDKERENIIVETQGRKMTLVDGTMISIDATI